MSWLVQNKTGNRKLLSKLRRRCRAVVAQSLAVELRFGFGIGIGNGICITKAEEFHESIQWGVSMRLKNSVHYILNAIKLEN